MNLFDSEYRDRHLEKKPWLSWIPYGFPFYYEPLVKDGNYKTPRFSFEVPDGLDLKSYYSDSTLWMSVAKNALYQGQVTGEQLEEILEVAYITVKQKQHDKNTTVTETGDALLQQVFDEQGGKITELLLQGTRFDRIAEMINCPKNLLKQLIKGERVQNLLNEKKDELKFLTGLLGITLNYEYYRSLHRALTTTPEDMEEFALILKIASAELKATPGTSRTPADIMSKVATLATPSSDDLIKRFEDYAFGLSDEI